MASVIIDLGFGEQAILSEGAASGIVTAKHQRDAEEFLRRWPRTRSIHQERDYLRQLRLHMGYNPPGVNSSDASALLRSAVKSGKVVVVIERATRRMGGGGGVPQSTRQSGAIGSSRQSFAEMAAGGSGASAMLSDAVSAPTAYSWMQSYDDVSADDLIKYLESVIASTRPRLPPPTQIRRCLSETRNHSSTLTSRQPMAPLRSRKRQTRANRVPGTRIPAAARCAYTAVTATQRSISISTTITARVSRTRITGRSIR